MTLPPAVRPLVTIALGVVVLCETLRPLQWIAVGIGAIACIYLTIDNGNFPLIPLVLAGSFAMYGLLKKQIGGTLTRQLRQLGHDVAVALIASSPDGQYASTQTVLTSMAEALAQAETQWPSPAC